MLCNTLDALGLQAYDWGHLTPPCFHLSGLHGDGLLLTPRLSVHPEAPLAPGPICYTPGHTCPSSTAMSSLPPCYQPLWFAWGWLTTYWLTTYTTAVSPS